MVSLRAAGPLSIEGCNRVVCWSCRRREKVLQTINPARQGLGVRFFFFCVEMQNDRGAEMADEKNHSLV